MLNNSLIIQKAYWYRRFRLLWRVFQSKLTKTQIASEHCIGILKNWYPCLKCNNIKVEGKKRVKNYSEFILISYARINILYKYSNSYVWEMALLDQISILCREQYIWPSRKVETNRDVLLRLPSIQLRTLSKTSLKSILLCITRIGMLTPNWRVREF